jgi:acyl-CoA synthetase (AMP-forming)/AMP-acid ligase II
MMEPFNIVDLFYASAKKHPDKTAIIYKGQKISFGEFQQQVTATSAYFLKKGIKKGDRVMLFVPMSFDLYRIVLALFRIGATAVFLDEWVNKKRMEECCKVAQCQAFIGIFKARILSFFSSELRKIPIHLGLGYSASDSHENFPATSKDDTALITFTTGSTGIPKAAKRTHGFLHAQFSALIAKIDPQEDDIDMPVLPIVLLINLGAGTTSVIADFKASKPNSLRPEKIIEQLKAYGVNRIIASPFFVKEISKQIIKHKIPLPQLKKIFTGGAPVFPTEARIYDQAFPGAMIQVVYGSTEAEPISAIDVKELVKNEKSILEKGLNVGMPDKNASVKIIRIVDAPLSVNNEEELSELEIHGKKIGEIIVSGDHVLREYFNNAEGLKRNKIFIGKTCWHRTGDSGYLDEDGNLFLTGRCATLISRNEKIIAPFIYESFFQTIPGVEMGTVMLLGEKLFAVIELNDLTKEKTATEKTLRSGISFDEVIFIEKIPRDPRHNSKIDYTLLRQELNALFHSPG